MEEGLSKLIPKEKVPILKEVLESDSLKEYTVEGSSAKDVFSMFHQNGLKVMDQVNKNMSFNEGEVLLAAYPKTGTNWTLEIINRLMFQDTEEFDKWKLMPMNLNILEIGSPKKWEIFNELPFKRRVFSTHFQASDLNLEMFKKKNTKIVYVLRNPKDVMVSMFNFCKKLPPFSVEPMKSLVSNGFQSFYEAYMNYEIPIDGYRDQNYLDHIVDWMKHVKQNNIYIVYYENLQQDFKGEVRKLADYLQVEVSDDKLDEIANECTIASMRKNYQKRFGFHAQLAPMFVFKGGVGGWKDHLTVRQSEEWDKMVKEKLEGSGVNFRYTI